MKFLVVILALVGQSLALEPIMKDYFKSIGIPAAERTKAMEEAMDFSGSRIWNGQVTSLGQFPYFAGLLISLNELQAALCGATLLTNTHSVTAAHCWNDGNIQGQSMELVFGSLTIFTGGLRIRTSQIEVHSNYRPITWDNDIGIITHSYVQYSDIIGPATLPSGFHLYLTFEGTMATAVGFGRYGQTQGISQDQSLRHTSMEVISVLDCQATYGFDVTQHMLCTSTIRGTSTCTGDSGGPLVANSFGSQILIGITSWTAGSGCQSGFPAGFTRVTSYVPWINARI